MGKFVAELDSPGSRLEQRQMPADLAAWHAFVLDTYANDVYKYPLFQGARIVPVAKALGNALEVLSSVRGFRARVKHAFRNQRSHFDGMLFEALIAKMYAIDRWEVEFLSPANSERTPDLYCTQGRRELWVECKKKSAVSDFARQEREAWIRQVKPILDMMVNNGMAMYIDVVFHVEISSLPPLYLTERLKSKLLLAGTTGVIEDSPEMTCSLKRVRLDGTAEVLRHNYVRIHSTRLTELLFGDIEPSRGVTMSMNFSVADHEPSLVSKVSWACGAIWSCDAPTAVAKRMRHWKRELSEAVSQLPDGKPGAVHWGIEIQDDENAKAELYRQTVEAESGMNFAPKMPVLLYAHVFRFTLPADGVFDAEETVWYFRQTSDARRYQPYELRLVTAS
jgi:hypothetical protein